MHLYKSLHRTTQRCVVILGAAMLLFSPVPAHAGERCVWMQNAFFATASSNCTLSTHSGSAEGYISADCTGSQTAFFDIDIPTGPGKTFTVTSYVESTDTGSGKICAVGVALLSMVGHCLTPAGATTNDGAVCNVDSDCTGGRTCTGGVPDGTGVPLDMVPVTTTRTFAANTRYVSSQAPSISTGDIKRWGDDGASAWGAQLLDCGNGSCTGHVGKLHVQFNTSLNAFCTASGVPYHCCTGSAAGTCNTTASQCAWYALCVETAQ